MQGVQYFLNEQIQEEKKASGITIFNRNSSRKDVSYHIKAEQLHTADYHKWDVDNFASDSEVDQASNMAGNEEDDLDETPVRGLSELAGSKLDNDNSTTVIFLSNQRR